MLPLSHRYNDTTPLITNEMVVKIVVCCYNSTCLGSANVCLIYHFAFVYYDKDINDDV